MATALVVYESLFGDARSVAEAIAVGLSAGLSVRAVGFGDAPAAIGAEVGLLVVGGPTHQFGMPRRASRRQATQQYDLPGLRTDRGLREWLTALAPVREIPAAAFDTRLDHPRFLRHTDHAARTEEKLLRERGFRLVAPAASYYVASTTGPLLEGELRRAEQWGRTLGGLVLASPGV